MTGPRVVLAILAAGLVGALVLPVSESPVSAESTNGVVFSFVDDRIVESSGLVDLGKTMVTVNDSGDTGRVFVVDPASGRTVGVTNFAEEVVDVEALAPAGTDHVWVGDIGDNAHTRPWIRVFRVPVSAEEVEVAAPEVYYLNYPDGPHDAEAIVVDDSGTLVVVTKSAAGGKVYQAPAELSATSANKLKLVGQVDEYVTDGALTEDQRHVLLRGLGQASLYTYPDFELVRRFALPNQRQGEGVSLGPRDRVRLSSEGAHTAVLEMELPGKAGSQPPEGSVSQPAGESAGKAAEAPGAPRSGWLLATIPAVIAVGGLAIALILRRSRKWS